MASELLERIVARKLDRYLMPSVLLLSLQSETDILVVFLDLPQRQLTVWDYCRFRHRFVLYG